MVTARHPQTIQKKLQQGPNILCMRKETAFRFLSNLIASCRQQSPKNLQQIIEFGTATTYTHISSLGLEIQSSPNWRLNPLPSFMAMTDPSPCHILQTFPQMPCLLREQVKAP